MRIIGGSAGGRRLVGPRTNETRPATDRVREAVFSALGDSVVSARVLDLYAGTGSYGLEALSRGASRAVFVENGLKALEALRKNIEVVGLGGIVFDTAVTGYLARAEESFDLVFMDPPWALSLEQLESNMVALNRLCESGTEIIISRRHADEVVRAPESWVVAADRRYGDTRILRYEKRTQET